MAGFVNSVEYYALLEIFILLAFAELLRSVAERYGFPPTVGQVIAGVVLGAGALGGVLNGLLGVQLFVINDLVLLFADFSVILLIFAAGLEGGFSSLRAAGSAAIGAAILGDVVPFAATFVVFSFFFPIHTALLIGVAAAATSTAVVAAVLRSEELTRAPAGKFLMNVAALDDVVGLLLLSVALNFNPSNPNIIAISGGLAFSVIAWLVILFASVYIIPRILRPISSRASHDIPFVILFALVAIVAALGFSAIIGAFIAGLAVGESLLATRTKRIADILVAIFGSLFFIVIGAQFDAHALLDYHVLLYGVLLVVTAVLGKTAGVYVIARFRFPDPRVARAIAIGMIPRAEIGLIVGAIGYSIGAFDQTILGAIILMALITTAIGGYFFRRTAHALSEEPSGVPAAAA
ncbi:MAG TPA: cation:proton antiporter [Thermoplasmata archaeon]|nr:cation:proton antiporter [Thermoplasmata archaeon]